MTDPILLVDTWQYGGEIDEATLLANGVVGILIRINQSDGSLVKDANFDKQWSEAAHMIRIPYFVYSPTVLYVDAVQWLMDNVPAEARALIPDVEVKRDVTPLAYAERYAAFYGALPLDWNKMTYTGGGYIDLLAYWPADDYWWAQYPYTLRPDTVQHWTWEQLKAKLANYTGPLNADKIPGPCKLWQFTADRLILPGCEKPMDVNLWLGTMEELQDFAGVSKSDIIHTASRAYDSDVHTVIIPPGSTIKVHASGRQLGSKVYELTHAAVIANGGDYNPYTGDITGICAVDGVVKSPHEGYMPWVNILADGTVHINDSSNREAPYNAFAMRRLLVLDGKESPNQSAAWEEVHPRTVYGVRADGALVIVTVDGRSATSRGANLHECAALLIQAGAIRGGDGGGGGDTQLYLDGRVVNKPVPEDYPGGIRPVADYVIVLTGDIPETGGTMQYKVIWSDGASVRPRPTTAASTIRKLPFGYVVEVTQDNVPDASYPNDVNKRWVQLADGNYAASNYPDGTGPKVRMEKVTAEPPPPSGEVTLTHTIEVYSDGSLKVDGNPIA